MNRKGLLLVCAAIVFLPAACFFYAIHEKAKTVFTTYQIETTLEWSGGPDIKLDPKRMDQLNREVDDLIQSNTPGAKFNYPIVSLDKKRLEVLYAGDNPGAPESLQKTLNAFIQWRASELAKQQIQSAGQ
jgi:hypothetical protein